MSLDTSLYGDMKIGELLGSLEGGKDKAGGVGSLLASVFGDAFGSYDFAGMAGKSLDEVIVTLSNGQIDIATAGDLLTSALGDKWRDYKWEDLTMNDIIKVISASMKDGVPELESTAKEASTETADAMEDEEYYSGIGGKNILGYAAGIRNNISVVGEATLGVANASSEPLTSLDSYAWGEHISKQYASGIKSKLAAVEAAARALANAVAGFIHFSEPDVGPLSDFHTYAPDMIKLWCKGVYDNLGKVEDSSESMADTVYDGFSTALEYVSDLINDGMSDELTIRPVMDLSEIQNGIQNLDSMIGGANGYSLSGTAKLAASAASGFTPSASVNAAPVEANAAGPVNNYNTFNITNNDPTAVAEKVSRLIGQETKRAQAVWAR